MLIQEAIKSGRMFRHDRGSYWMHKIKGKIYYKNYEGKTTEYQLTIMDILSDSWEVDKTERIYIHEVWVPSDLCKGSKIYKKFKVDKPWNEINKSVECELIKTTEVYA